MYSRSTIRFRFNLVVRHKAPGHLSLLSLRLPMLFIYFSLPSICRIIDHCRLSHLASSTLALDPWIPYGLSRSLQPWVSTIRHRWGYVKLSSCQSLYTMPSPGDPGKALPATEGWRHAKWKPILKLFKEERAEEAVLEFIRRTGVGKMSGAREPRAEDEISVAESEGWPPWNNYHTLFVVCYC